ncbi:hypothetical protein BJ944DRAFT_268806 [Cunninghamella echinulata]|nr:hypothetical protein BJ944DRAFT_268806 [Cunninghamella echinulata]
MNLFGLGRKLLQNNNNNNKKKSSLDLRKTQSTGNINQFNHPIPVNITFATPTDLKPILAKSTSQFKPLKEEIEEEEEDEDHDDNKLNNDSQQSSFNDHISTKSSSLEEFNSDHHQQHENIAALSDRLKTITADDMDLLLSLETQARMDHLAEQQEKEKEKRFQQQQQSKKLKFALPDIPLRESSIYPNNQSKLDSNLTLDEHQHNDYIPIAKRWSLPEETIRQDMKKKNNNNQYFKNSKWMKFLSLTSSTYGNGNNNNSNGNHNQQEENHDQTELKYGCKVKLIRSPIKTTAYVRYVGPVHFAPGEWVGLELERAVGKNDGSVDGQRYFHTGAYRGIFLTRDELLVVK